MDDIDYYELGDSIFYPVRYLLNISDRPATGRVSGTIGDVWQSSPPGFSGITTVIKLTETNQGFCSYNILPLMKLGDKIEFISKVRLYSTTHGVNEPEASDCWGVEIDKMIKLTPMIENVPSEPSR